MGRLPRSVRAWTLATLAMIAGCREGRSAHGPRENATPAVAAPAEVITVARASDAAALDDAHASVTALPRVHTDWCIDGLDALDQETCVVLPPRDVPDRRLLIYLHGIVPPQADSDQKRTVETIV